MKIKSITEAYSRQPKSFNLTPENEVQFYKEKSVKEIKAVRVTVGDEINSIHFMAYVGYNYDGNIIFEYKCDSVNVEYEATA